MCIKRFTEMGKVNENEEHDSFGQDMQSIYHEVNLINLITDEGYLNGLNLKNDLDIEDLNSFLKEREMGIGFESSEELHNMIINTLESMRDLANTYLK